MEEPLLSICIPTYNRADLLEYCLENLREFERCDIPFEVVVSDNASEDRTQEVLRAQSAKMPYLKAVRMNATGTIDENVVNMYRNASGRYIVYLADDDSLITEELVRYVGRMEADPSLSVIIADWIAYDDVNGSEMHRYFHFSEPARFGPEDPLGLISFVLQYVVLPDTGIFRRDALLRAGGFSSFIRRSAYAALQWLYHVSRVGAVAFELAPFYREHRVLKPRFRREGWHNITLQYHLIGDEFRNILESLVLWAFQDAGYAQVPHDQLGTVRQMIDGFLNARVPLEIRRAILKKDWLLAAELRRRLVLWHGPGTPEQQRHDVAELVLPAALQAVALGYRQLKSEAGLMLRGFRTPQVATFFRQHFPDVALVEDSYCGAGVPATQPAILFKDEATSGASSELLPSPDRTFQLNQLIHLYRVNTATVDLSAL